MLAVRGGRNSRNRSHITNEQTSAFEQAVQHPSALINDSSDEDPSKLFRAYYYELQWRPSLHSEKAFKRAG